MKRFTVTSLILILTVITAYTQEVKDVSMAGIFTEGKTLTASYTIEGASGSETVGLQWMRVNLSGGPDTTDLATTGTYLVDATDVGFRLLLRVDIDDGGTQDTAYSALSPVIIANTEPVASNVTLTGGLGAGEYIFADYDYNDIDDDTEGSSVFRWVISSAGDFSDTTVISGATTKTYQIQSADEGKYFFFGVRPVALSGVQETGYTWSAVHGPVTVNSAPVVSGVGITGGLSVGDIITADYNYYDADNDPEGTSVYRWVKSELGNFSDTVVISGATGKSYTILSADEGDNFFFGVRPVALSGVQETGYTWSAVHGPVTVNSAPVISGVSITGGLDAGDIITADYNYYDADNDPEGTSVYRWVKSELGNFSDTVVISGATGKSYTILSADEGDNFFFGVRPVALSGVQETGYTWSAVHGPVTENSAPVISGVSITGGLDAGDIITADYNYYDADNDPEGTSVYRWVKSELGNFSDTVVISGATGKSYTILSADEGDNFFFGVRPVALSGVQETGYTWSAVHGPVTVNSAPVVSGVGITGGLSVGDIITAGYSYYDADNDAEGTSVYRWVKSELGNFSDTVVISGATGKSYTILSADEGDNFFFGVRPVAVSGTQTTDYTWSSVHGPVVVNTAPTTSNRTITGGYYVDDVLIGDYDYSDADNDLEGDSRYKWAVGNSTNFGEAVIVGTETYSSYKIKDSDQGKYVFFGVQPIAQTGVTDGTEEWTSAHGPIDSQPYATGVNIDNLSPEVGNVLTGSYIFNDIDGDGEATPELRWLRDGTEVIQGATSDTYEITYDDIGYTIVFEVTPVASEGYPLEGDPVQSAPTAVVPAAGVPTATDICISGTRATGSVLTGNYTYNYGKQEGVSIYRWYRDNVIIPAANAKTYTVTDDDLEADIRFAVTPVSKAPVVTGVETFSDSLALFIIPNDEVSVADPPFELSASPSGGLFSGQGVSVDTFDPSSVNTDNSPFILEYLLNIQYAEHTCIQKSRDTISVRPVETYFTSFKNVYCYDNGNDTIIVRNYPDDASLPVFEFTEPAAVVTQLNDTTIVFNPALMGPGNNDSVYFRYVQAASVIEISKGFVVDSVGTAIEFQNLEDKYCTDASARYISVDNVYPAGGSAVWTGDMLTNKSATSAILDPVLVTAGAVYPVTYQYTSPNGCKSIIINRDVTINPLPDPGFTIDPTYNVEGDPDLLVPVLTGGTFTGSGIVGDEFYPDLAGVGSHEVRYSVTDANGCFATTTNNTLVREAQGTIDDLPPIICYDDITIAISVSGLPGGVTINGFGNTSGGLTSTGTTTADYYVPSVGSGYDTVSFAYIWDGVDYEIWKEVYIDSIGKVEIIGLNDQYCEYEGDVNMRVSVENSTGAGNFLFSGPDTSFVNYGVIADLYPYKTPPSASPYQVSYTHVSTVQSSGCTKTITRDVYVYPEPDVEILTDRSTANLDETPFELEGSPANGTFSGSGIYRDGAVYKFNPMIAGAGLKTIVFSYVDANTCYSSASKDILVVQAQGTIEGINYNNQYCYDGTTDTLTYVNSSPGWTGIGFQGEGISNINNVKAAFDPAVAGRGEHKVLYSYYDSVLTKFEIPVTLKVDSIGTVEINNLDPGTEFCNNQEPVELFTSKLGGVFTGPVDDNFLDPSLGIGDTQVSYTYTNMESGCFVSVTVPVRINPAPQVDFNVDDVCIEYTSDTTHFMNLTVSDDPVATWEWRLGDPGSYNESNLENPGHLYKTYGPRLVKLTATTVNGCQSTAEKNIDLGIKPRADFSWTGDCYIMNDSIVIFDKSSSTTPITGYSWNFFDGEPPLTGEEIKYPKRATGAFDVRLIVETAYDNCHDTITKEVTIRPTVTLMDDNYYEDFEDNQGGWIPGLGEYLNEWSFGTPDRETIDKASSGINAWYTGFDVSSQDESGYSVESPCFDFTDVERPYVSVDIWKHFDRNRDGAALQYKIGNTGDWKLVGSLDDGISWYNSVLISGSPGGQSIGWTSVAGKDTGWVNVRNKLDVLAGKRDIKFRIVYGSDGTANENEGFAFDNFSIGTRSRNVLLEHFTNYNNVANKEANELLSEVTDNAERDVISVQYHANIPSSDGFYLDNEADVSARMLYYGLPSTPYSFVDGGINSLYAYEYDYVLNNKIDSVDLYKRSMISPLFDISLNSQINGGVLTASCDIKALENVNAQNLTLYLLVIEKETVFDAPNGETVFYNVFKKMLPDAGGTDLKKTWAEDDTESFDNFSWLIENIYDTGDIEIIAFIQNNTTKQVYQAASTIQVNVPTDVPFLNGDRENGKFAVYPNPASDYLTVSFREELESESVLNIYNYAGNIVYTRKLPAGMPELRIDGLSLPEGMYIIRLVRGGSTMDYKKLIISER